LSDTNIAEKNLVHTLASGKPRVSHARSVYFRLEIWRTERHIVQSGYELLMKIGYNLTEDVRSCSDVSFWTHLAYHRFVNEAWIAVIPNVPRALAALKLSPKLAVHTNKAITA
jgi:hypothetical protein